MGWHRGRAGAQPAGDEGRRAECSAAPGVGRDTTWWRPAQVGEAEAVEAAILATMRRMRPAGPHSRIDPMPLSRRERVLRALRHEPLDRLPTQVGWTAPMGDRLASHFGVPVSALAERFDNHLVRLDLSHRAQVGPDGRTRRDWWGAGHDAEEEGYFIRESPLATNADLDAFTWPDPTAAGPVGRRRPTAGADGRGRLRGAQPGLRPLRAGLVAAWLRAAALRPGRRPGLRGGAARPHHGDPARPHRAVPRPGRGRWLLRRRLRRPGRPALLAGNLAQPRQAAPGPPLRALRRARPARAHALRRPHRRDRARTSWRSA